jgi:Uncharacterized conserved protein
MQILWLDCRSEFTGEALVGALADLGVSPSIFEWELSGVELGDFHLHFDREETEGIRAVRFGVHGGILHMEHGHSSKHDDDHSSAHRLPYPKLRTQIETATVPDFVKLHSLGILHRIAIAQAELAKISLDQIEFPESDALDWLVTAVLSCIGLEQLQASQMYFQQRSQPQPAERPPSHAALSRVILSKASTNEQIAASLLGAAILAEFDAILTTPPELKSVKIGHGLGPGDENGESAPLRATLGEIE